jgi:aldose 1-epimerase
MVKVVQHIDVGAVGGMRIHRIEVASAESGFSVTLINLGATVTSLRLPDRHGTPEEVTLGHDDFQSYLLEPRAYLGATIGRVANRIAGGEFSLEGTVYRLAKNDRGLHCLHGGARGFDQVVWDVGRPEVVGRAVRLPFSYVSPHMEEGFPGRLSVEVVYTIGESSLEIEYRATTDRTTIVNLTNHIYWNLEGLGGGPRPFGRTCLDHILRVRADFYLPVDETLAPTGEIAPVARTALDLRSPRRIRDVVRLFGDIDHCCVVAGEGLRTMAELHEPRSGRWLSLTSDQPGLQVYTGNYLEGVPYRGGVARRYGAVCLEAQGFPDAVHHPHFPQVTLAAHDVYRRTITYLFGTL